MPGNISVILPCDVGGPTWQNMCIEHGHWRMVRQPGAVSAAVRAQVSFITLDLRPDKDASIVKSVAISFETRGVWIFCCFIIFCNRIFCLVSFDAERVRFILFSNTYFNIFFHQGVYYSASTLATPHSPPWTDQLVPIFKWSGCSLGEVRWGSDTFYSIYLRVFDSEINLNSHKYLSSQSTK